MPTAIEARRLCKSYGKTQALKDCSLAVEEGTFFGLLGPNGAGKSTFMATASGFLCQDSGELRLLGRQISSRARRQDDIIGFSPQSIALYKNLSAEQNLSLFGKLYGLSGSTLRQRIDEAMELAQLKDRRRSQVKEFSGGMMRRLNIAASLLHRPRILLCDEPTVGVHPQSRNAIFDTLQQLNRNGMTIVYSTHYMEEAERLCHEIAIIDHGAILRQGKLDTLLAELPAKHQVSFRPSSLEPAHLEGLRSFGSLENDGSESRLLFHPDQPLSAFYRWTETEKISPSLFQLERASLENLFLHLTGRELRE